MAIGNNLKKLRTQKGITQKELAEKLHVSSQAISRWENDEVEPDISTLSKLSNIYGVAVDDIINGGGEVKSETKPVEEEPKKAIGTCIRCGKTIYEGDDYLDKSTPSRRVRKGRHHVTVPGSTIYYCASCKSSVPASSSSTISKTSTTKVYKPGFGTKRLVGAIILGIATLVATMIVFLNLTKLPIAASIILPIFLGYGVCATFYCILTDCMASEVFFDVATFSIKMPGVIFTFDADGIKALIVMKIVLALLGAFLGLCLVGLGFILAMLLAIFMFPFMGGKEPMFD